MRESETRRPRGRPAVSKAFKKDGVLGQGARQAKWAVQRLTVGDDRVRVRGGGVLKKDGGTDGG
jgi:hypothetical protein